MSTAEKIFQKTQTLPESIQEAILHVVEQFALQYPPSAAESMTMEELWDWEAKNPVVFASPSALAEARVIAELDKLKRSRRRARTKAAAPRPPRRKPAAA